MDIIVSNMDSTPIYEQITRQINPRRRAAAGGGAAVYAPAGEGAAHQRYHDQACV